MRCVERVGETEARRKEQLFVKGRWCDGVRLEVGGCEPGARSSLGQDGGTWK